MLYSAVLMTSGICFRGFIDHGICFRGFIETAEAIKPRKRLPRSHINHGSGFHGHIATAEAEHFKQLFSANSKPNSKWL
jgi:hypothetical protein